MSESVSNAINQAAVKKMIRDNWRLSKFILQEQREFQKQEYTISFQIFWGIEKYRKVGSANGDYCNESAKKSMKKRVTCSFNKLSSEMIYECITMTQRANANQ
ncbi:hypothetical protein PoB_006991900 [Plakobranchus ocellatus]|uniref:Uncharacterized protein n=1 Tax=Plakobranchus ocellatus TaxID=259542 RepID=A0AAV4DGP1_9GAST|nr:hypothetical protein PoB_006991900 [Plakobranchus ocellatus]